MKVILIPVSDRPECVLTLHHGFLIAQQTQSSVIGYHIRSHKDSDINMPEEITDSRDYYDLVWAAALKEKGKDGDHIKAQILFKNTAEKYDYEMSKKHKNTPCALWEEKVGSPDKIFTIMGPVSDLIIVSRPDKKGRSLAKIFMLEAIIKSSAPVLVLPQVHIDDLGKRICIAWNQSKEAMRAVKAALPLLQQADQVSIVTCRPENKLGPKVKHLKSYLSSYNVKADHVRIKSNNDSQAIVKGYKETRSDLLVMGGYSRSRLRQQVFGGVTEHMLNEAKIPIFILHM